jgi:hypothetical protein
MGLAEINAFMREQRHARRANRARAEAEMKGINMDDLIAQAEREQQNERGSDSKPDPREPNKEMGVDEINAYMREQRQLARQNRARAEAAEREAVDSPPPFEEDNASPPSEKQPEMDLAGINAFMRDQRHARRANQARAEAELQGINMDDLIAQAEKEQRESREPPSHKERKLPAQARNPVEPAPKSPRKIASPGPARDRQTPPRCSPIAQKAGRRTLSQPDDPRPENVAAQPAIPGVLSADEIKDLFRKQRDELKMNRERIRRGMDGSRDIDLTPAGAPLSRLPPAEARQSESEGTSPDSTRSIALEPVEKGADDEPRLASPESNQDEELTEDIRDLPDEERLSLIVEQAKALNDALDLADEHDEEPEAELPSGQFHIGDQIAILPVVSDGDSPAYRVEAICALLERELGIEKLVILTQAASGEDEETEPVEKVLRGCHPAITVLAQQFLVLKAAM